MSTRPRAPRLPSLLVVLLTLAALVLSGCAGPAVQPTPASSTKSEAKPTPAQTQSQATAVPTTSAAKPAPTNPATVAPKAADKPLQPPVTVKVGITRATADAGFYIGVEKGYYKELGLEVELIPFDSAAAMVPSLGTGQLDVGRGAVSASLFSAIVRGIPIKLVADSGHVTPEQNHVFLVVRKELVDSGEFKDYKDLKGKTIADPTLGSISAIHIEKALEKGGLTSNDVKMVVLPGGDMNVAFANKSIDVADAFEPFVTLGLGQGLITRFKGVGEIYPNHQISTVMYSPDFAAKKSEAANRFMLAYVKAIRDYDQGIFKNKGRDEIIAILMKHTSLKDRALYDKMGHAPIDPNGRLKTKSLVDIWTWFYDKGQVSKPVDLNALVDGSFAEYAVSKLGEAR